ncbi:MAG: putative hydrolase [Actinomycetia bacterium]|nr:putative hydrolase [Actinomycetes bacterium]
MREVAGPPGAPVVVLLHGLAATAGLNWFTVFRPLSKHYRVIALDHRGHGRGLEPRGPFRLTDAADDVVALADVLGIDRFIPIGYSMGGPIAQLCWLRHRERVEGLVLCATSRNFRGHPRDQLMFASLPLATLALRVPGVPAVWANGGRVLGERLAGPPFKRWAQEELRHHDRRAIVGAAGEVGRFSSRDWIGDIDVPTSVVLHTRDQLVPVRRQWKLAQAIPGAAVYVVEGDHFVVARDPKRFVPVLLDATASVVLRARILAKPRLRARVKMPLRKAKLPLRGAGVRSIPA